MPLLTPNWPTAAAETSGFEATAAAAAAAFATPKGVAPGNAATADTGLGPAPGTPCV